MHHRVARCEQVPMQILLDMPSSLVITDPLYPFIAIPLSVAARCPERRIDEEASSVCPGRAQTQQDCVHSSRHACVLSLVKLPEPISFNDASKSLFPVLRGIVVS